MSLLVIEVGKASTELLTYKELFETARATRLTADQRCTRSIAERPASTDLARAASHAGT
jgi:hypothetical protein